jgi:acetyltransferase-like isoleucine patch superfamily enzyme
MAEKVYISDNIHAYKDVTKPIMHQPIVHKGNVYIGDNSWIGESVSIIGANIGKHCVIGANSVVTHDIPDYCVAVGSPAKVIKRYNFDINQWEMLK